MTDHRVRLTDSDLELILAALRARAAMTHGPRRLHLQRLTYRLAEMTRGNPNWIFGPSGEILAPPPRKP